MKKIFNWRTMSMSAVAASLVVLAAGSVEPTEPTNPSTPTPGEEETPLDPSIAALIAKTTIYTDAASSELMSIITAQNDTITYYGDKAADGTAKQITTMEYSSVLGENVFLNFDASGKIQSINSNNGASVDFEWVNNATVVIKALSMKDNIVIQTKYDFNNGSPTDVTTSRSNVLPSIREGELYLDITPTPEYTPEHASLLFNVASRATYDPDDFAETQQVHLWINQCGSSYNAMNYILMKNATTSEFVGKLVNSEQIATGSYIYELPIKSYPASATHAELCAKLDEALRNMEKWMGWIYVDDGAALGYVLTALNTAAISTGIGAAPAVVVDAVVFAGAAINCGVQIFNSTGGVTALMKQYNADWYYKEYINSDLILIPVAYTQSKTVVGEETRVNPADESIFITIDMGGNPVIDNFTLNPSNPGAGQSYDAIAEYHCVPAGSVIKLSIIGTDGYQNSISKTVSDFSVSGTATLRVPGAATGVYDLCTVEITLPTNEVISMQASLVFGN